MLLVGLIYWLGPGWSLIVQFGLRSWAETGWGGSWLELNLGSRLVNWFDLVPGLRLAWFRWFGLCSWLELDLPDQRPSHVVAPPPEPGSWSRACGASKDF